ncbi:MAG: GNAT family N-acetyltransferase [Methanomassiliicoccales archaeon]
MSVVHEVMTEEGLDLIGPLWLELRQMHRARSTHFKSALGSKSFEERREELLDKAAGGLMRVELAREDDGRVVAYCVSSVGPDMTGEVDSIFVTAAYRRAGIGTSLMEGALRWMEGLGVKRRVLLAIVGNEEVHAFYARFGFLPKSVLLEQSQRTGGTQGPDKPI